MSVANHIQIAERVASNIEATVLASSGTVARTYFPVKGLENEALTVSVTFPSEERGYEGRGTWRREYRVDVVIQQRMPVSLITDEDQEQFYDDKVMFTQEVADFLEENPLDPSGTATFPLDAVQTLVEVVYENSLLELVELKLFAATVRVTYRARKI